MILKSVYREDPFYRVTCQFHDSDFDQVWNRWRQIIVLDHVIIYQSLFEASCKENGLKLKLDFVWTFVVEGYLEHVWSWNSTIIHFLPKVVRYWRKCVHLERIVRSSSILQKSHHWPCIGKRENLYRIDKKIMIKISVAYFILALSLLCE